MSRKQHPTALTAAMLMGRLTEMMAMRGYENPSLNMHVSAADLATRLHRLARGAAKASLAECNGELYPGQRDSMHRWSVSGSGDIAEADAKIDEAVNKYAARIDRAIAKLNAALAPLAIEARRNGDPRGFAIKLRSTDPTRPLPSNEMGGEWGIA